MNRHKDYKVQDGCWNCKHKFVKEDYEESPQHYCTLGAEPRPKCGSVSMREEFTYPNIEDYILPGKSGNNFEEDFNHDQYYADFRDVSKFPDYNNWWEWSKENIVSDVSICENHIKEDRKI